MVVIDHVLFNLRSNFRLDRMERGGGVVLMQEGRLHRLNEAGEGVLAELFWGSAHASFSVPGDGDLD